MRGLGLRDSNTLISFQVYIRGSCPCNAGLGQSLVAVMSRTAYSSPRPHRAGSWRSPSRCWGSRPPLGIWRHHRTRNPRSCLSESWRAARGWLPHRRESAKPWSGVGRDRGKLVPLIGSTSYWLYYQWQYSDRTRKENFWRMIFDFWITCPLGDEKEKARSAARNTAEIRFFPCGHLDFESAVTAQND